MVTNLEPYILECEVKWALGNITVKKASGDGKIQSSYFKAWKMMLLKYCTQYVSKFGKLRNDHKTGKGKFSFQSQRRGIPKNIQTIVQLHSFYMLAG